MTQTLLEVTVLVNSCDLKAVSLALDGYQRLAGSDIKFSTFEVPDSEDAGSATALMALRNAGKVKVRETSALYVCTVFFAAQNVCEF